METNFGFNAPKESPGYLLTHVSLLWKQKQRTVLRPFDLTLTQFTLLSSLAWLSKSDSVVTQVDIADFSNSDRMMTSKVLRTLEQKKYITRKEHPTDTRAKIISLTPSGVEIVQKAIVAVGSVDKEFFAVINEDISLFNKTLLHLMDFHK